MKYSPIVTMSFHPPMMHSSVVMPAGAFVLASVLDFHRGVI